MLVLNDIQTVLGEVLAERLRQHGKWGEQNHSPEIWLMILGEEVGEVTRGALEAWAYRKALRDDAAKGWLEHYRRELIQVAAVAVAAVQSIDRNELSEAG